ncbi:MAG: hypothetical protein ACKO91_08150 [Acidimicrobiales bacterium]
MITAACVPLESGLGAVKRSTGASYEPVHELLDLLRTAADRLDDVIASCVAGLLESPNDGQFQSN